jgi:hypothetical protein
VLHIGQSIHEHSTVAAAREQTSCDFDGEAVVLNLESEKYYGLNDVAARIWAMIQRPATVKDIRDGLLAEFDVDADRLGRDLAAWLTKMAEAGLVEITDGATRDETAE